jgi:opacity protein-like surface antigen
MLEFRFSAFAFVCLLLMSSSSLTGQTADVSLGYSFVSSGLTFGSSTGSEGIRSAGRASLNGWDASASLRLSHWLRMAADVRAGYGSVPVDFFTLLGSGKGKVNTNLHTYLFGPRASVSVGRLAPFGQALFGVAHQSIPASASISNVAQQQNAFAFDLGGGVDVRLVSRVAWRVQADYLQTKLFDSTQRDPRIATGIVLRF